MDSPAAESRRPVLVGGTGRSGSTIVGHLLDHHRELTLCRPVEVRFISLRNGLADALAASRTAPDEAMRVARAATKGMLNRWYQRAEDVGLHQSVPVEEMRRLTAEYLDHFRIDPLVATQRLTYAVMDRIAERLQATRLVDTTPANARRADLLEPIYPECSIVVVTRDGRDVAASFVRQPFGPDDVHAALAQWEERMLQTHEAVARCRPGRVLTIELMDLVDRDRHGTVERLCAAIGVPSDPGMVAWFEENVNAAGMHAGRWRTDLDPVAGRILDAEYDAACARLVARGVRVPQS